MRHPLKFIDKLLLKTSYTRLGNRFLPIPRPHAVAIELTSVCNLQCVMCHLHGKTYSRHIPSRSEAERRPLGHMDFKLFEKIIEELSSFRFLPSIGLNFAGESLLYPDFFSAIRLLKRKGLSAKSGFNTNAVRLNSEIADVLINEYDGRVSISLDGFKESHESIRTNSDYNSVLKNIMYLIDRKNQAGSNTLQIDVNLTKVNQTSIEIQEFIDYWAPIVDSVHVYENVDYYGRLVTSNDHADRILVEKRRLCHFPFQYLAILWDGTVTFCCHDIAGRGRSEIKTNVKDDSILNIWRGPDFRRLREHIIMGDYADIPVCKLCQSWLGSYVKKDESTDKYAIKHKGLTVSHRLK